MLQATRAEVLGVWRDHLGVLDKFKISLAMRLPGEWPEDQVEGFVNFWADSIRLAWVTTVPKVRHTQHAGRLLCSSVTGTCQEVHLVALQRGL